MVVPFESVDADMSDGFYESDEPGLQAIELDAHKRYPRFQKDMHTMSNARY